MSIQNFYQTAQLKDFARLFQFRLISFGNVDFGPNELIYVETATLPGKQINNIPVPYMGLNFNVPGTVSFPGSAGYNVTFRCDADYQLRNTLERAISRTFDAETSRGEYSTPKAGYTLSLQLLNKKLEAIRTYTLYGTYVQALADSSYDIKDNGAVQTIQATLAYQYWKVFDGELEVLQPTIPPRVATQPVQNELTVGDGESQPFPSLTL